MKPRLVEQDDILIDQLLEHSESLRDVTSRVVDFYNNTDHTTTRDLLLGNVCKLMENSLEEAMNIMAPRGCALEQVIQVEREMSNVSTTAVTF